MLDIANIACRSRVSDDDLRDQLCKLSLDVMATPEVSELREGPKRNYIIAAIRSYVARCLRDRILPDEEIAKLEAFVTHDLDASDDAFHTLNDDSIINRYPFLCPMIITLSSVTQNKS